MLGNQCAGGCKQRLWGRLGLAIVLCLFAAGAMLSWRKWPDAQIDYGMQLYVPWQISQGAVLYSGVKYLVGGPLSQYFNACLFRVFGVSLLTLVAANLALAALWLTVLYRRFLKASDIWTATLLCSGIVLLFAFGQDSDIGNYNYLTPYCHELWHGLLLSTGALVFGSRWLERGRWYSAAAAGFCSGLVFMTKPEVFAALMAATVCALIVFCLRERRAAPAPGEGTGPTTAPNLEGVAVGRVPPRGILEVFQQPVCPPLLNPNLNPNPRSLLPSAAAFVAAGLVPLLLFFLYFLHFVSWRESLRVVCFAWVPLLESLAAHNPFYAWCLGLDAPLGNIEAMLMQFAVIVAGVVLCAWIIRWKPGRPAGRWATLMFAAVLLALASRYNWSDCGRALPLLSLVSCAVLVRDILSPKSLTETGTQAAWFPLIWSLFGLFLLGKLGLFSRIWHYGFVLAMPAFAAAVFFLFWLVPALAEKRSVSRNTFRAVIGLVLVVGFLRLFAQAQFIYREKTLVVGEGRDRITVFPGNINPVNPMIQTAVSWIEANTASNATLAVLPEGAMVNFLTRRTNPTGYPVWIPIEMQFFGETNMVSAFQRNSPDYVIFLPRDLSEFGVKPFGQQNGCGWQLVQWIRENYELAAKLNGGTSREAETGVVLKRISAGR